MSRKAIYIAAAVISCTILLVFSFIFGIQGYPVNVLVIHDGNSSAYLDTVQHFNQSLIANLRVKSVSLKDLEATRLKTYQLICLDSSIIGEESFERNKLRFIEYVSSGGSLYLSNDFYQSFSEEFIGVSGFQEVSRLPKELDFPKVRYNLQGVQELLKDFYNQYTQFDDKLRVQYSSLGYLAVPSTSVSLADDGKRSLFTVNRFGKGNVLFSSRLLPNENYVTGFDLQPKEDSQKYFNFTAASANYLFRNEFAAFVSKEQYGFVLKKVLGTYGRPAMAWQNHFEVLSAIRDGSIQQWTEFLKKYRQIPSYSLARSAYEWGDWHESITYYLNMNNEKVPLYTGEEDDSYYSSGKHAMVDNGYLLLQKYPEYKSLSWTVELPHRAYPSAADLDSDGIIDIISGSSDGYIYYFKGIGSGKFKNGIKLKGHEDKPIQVGSFSSPVLYDFNRDGKLDLIVGNEEGSVQVFMNQGNNLFSSPQPVLNGKPALKTVAPDIGDVDGDGVDDLVLGEAGGYIYLFKGSWTAGRLNFGEGLALASGDGTIRTGRFSAPRLFDTDGDGRKDIVAGSDVGTLKYYTNRYPKFIDNGFLQGEGLNPFGQKALWGGHNSVPCFADVNRDGHTDLLVGQLEFGLPVPIDNPDFPYQKELKEAIVHARKNFVDIVPHLFFHSYKSQEQEKREIQLHKEAFSFYGLPWEATGTNQHTWRTNNLYPAQSFWSEMEEGIWWNSGFRPPNNPVEPSLGREYARSMPFLLSMGAKQLDMVLFNPAPNLNLYKDAYPGIARWDLPISYFWHMEYPVLNDAGRKDLEYKADFLDTFRKDNDYNFMKESQMFRSFYSVLRTRAEITFNPVERFLDSLHSRLGAGQRFSFGIRITAAAKGAISGSYAQSVGFKLELGEKLQGEKFQTDAMVYLNKGENLYFGGGDNIRVQMGEPKKEPHIARVNMPIEIRKRKEACIIRFKEDGLQQIKIFSDKGIAIDNKEWEVQKEGDYYVLTRYGDKTELRVQFGVK